MKLLIIFISSLLFFSCKTTQTLEHSDINPIKSYAAFYVHNDISNSNIFYYKLNHTKTIKSLNTDKTLKFHRAPISKTYKVSNSQNDQLVLIELPKGKYGLTEIGKYSKFIEPYNFEIEDGSVNYIGDFCISLINYTVPFLVKPRDYYKIKIFSDIDKINRELKLVTNQNINIIDKSIPTTEYIYPIFNKSLEIN